MGFWAEMAAAVPAATAASKTSAIPSGNTTTRYQNYVKQYQDSLGQQGITPDVDSVFGLDGFAGKGTSMTDWLGKQSPEVQSDYATAYRDVQSQNSGSFVNRLGKLASFIPAAVGAAGLAGAAGVLGAGGGFPGASIFGGAETGLAGGGATGMDFGAAFEGLANGGGGATGLDFGAGMEGLAGGPEWAAGGVFNNPSLVSMPDVSPGMLSGQFNNPAFVSIPGLEGGSISAADAAAGGAAGSQAGGPTERPASMSSFSLESVLPQLMNFGQGGWGMPAVRTIAGLYGLLESRKLKKLGQLPNPGDITGMPGYQAGLEAVRRSMASQGFQGSGNMMAALQKYGGDFYNQYVGQRLASQQAQSGPVSGGMSSLALLASGLGGFYGR